MRYRYQWEAGWWGLRRLSLVLWSADFAYFACYPETPAAPKSTPSTSLNIYQIVVNAETDENGWQYAFARDPSVCLVDYGTSGLW